MQLRQHHTSQKLASIMSTAFGGKKAKNDNLGYLILQWGKEKDKMLQAQKQNKQNDQRVLSAVCHIEMGPFGVKQVS